ncbi:hypothetical protein [Nonomuraea zeae]|uniref:Uncharacterized protein n=1 Tax=Nonomuraea zeae TaxID=1642303 RepID=A0A5S4GPU1_9ACTN|nr:hypothetical protein [Nonomuraea zeae]TMR34839.1 hypothetical protein ETD85_15645 [Nonomuraea zeae]
MAKGCGYLLASLMMLVGVLIMTNALPGALDPGVVVVALLLLPIALGAFVIVHDTRRIKAAEAAEERLLARERDHVIRTVDFVADPLLTEDERLEIIDCFIPRLGRSAAASPYRDRFVVVSELAPSARDLLERARAAVMSVYTSEVMRLRLLDGLANEVLLPGQLWEIALLLRVQTHLHEEQREARQGVVTPELLAVLEPQQKALRRSIDAVTARIESLERYAHRVQEADAALRAKAALGNNDKYRALLAHTDDDEGMRELAAHGDALEETLARSVRQAIEAGQTLTS